MSKVIRLNEETIKDLDFFKSHYLSRLSKDIEDHMDSDFLCSLLEEKSDYNDSNWIAFAIRFASNHVDD